MTPHETFQLQLISISLHATTLEHAEKLTVNVKGGTLGAEHSVRDIGGTIVVGIADSEDTSLVGPHRSGDLDLSVLHFETHLSWEGRGLVGREVNEESITLDGLAFSELQEELVILCVRSIIPVLSTILDTLERGDRAVIDGDVPSLELLPPVFGLQRRGPHPQASMYR